MRVAQYTLSYIYCLFQKPLRQTYISADSDNVFDGKYRARVGLGKMVLLRGKILGMSMPLP